MRALFLNMQSSPENHGVITLKSKFSFAETVQQLLAIFNNKGIKVFATIDQRAEALTVGLSMPPATLIIFGNPKAGTPLMLANPQSAIDLPLKVLVSEFLPGEVVVTFNTAAYIIQRHALPVELTANFAPVERLIAAAVGIHE